MTFRNAVVVQLLQKGFSKNSNKQNEWHFAKTSVAVTLATETLLADTKRINITYAIDMSCKICSLTIRLSSHSIESDFNLLWWKNEFFMGSLLIQKL